MASLGRHPTRQARPMVPQLWGDGFSDDGFSDQWSVRDWNQCSPDEFIMVFPRLLPSGVNLPTALKSHLETCVSVRALRLLKLDASRSPPLLRAHLSSSVTACDPYSEWFVEDGAMAHLLRRVGILRTSPERLEAERSILVFLDNILAHIQQGIEPIWDEDSEVRLAFGAGFHPAYLWPQAALSHARGMTAGWLGLVDRGRAALMPLAVAEYLADVLEVGETSADPRLLAMSQEGIGVRALRRAAVSKLRGGNPVVRHAPGTMSLGGLVPHRSRDSVASATN